MRFGPAADALDAVDIAYQNKAVLYGLLFQAASETMTTIAAEPPFHNMLHSMPV